MHLWLGLISGLVVFILGLTGCIYVFIEEIKPIVYQERMYVPVPDNYSLHSINELRDSAQKKLGKEYPIDAVQLYTNEGRTWEFYAYKGNEEAGITSFDGVKYYWKVYVDPYTARVVKIENRKYEFFSIVLALHYQLLLNYEVGKFIVGWSTVIFIIMLISGIILWWPKNKSAAKQRFKFKWKSTTGWKRKNYDLHNIPGFYAMLIALAIALTGLTWPFQWFRSSLEWVANAGTVEEKKETELFSDTTKNSGVSLLDHICKDAKKEVPEFTSCYLPFPADKKSVVSLYTNTGDTYYNGVSLQYDQQTGALLKRSSVSDEEHTGDKLRYFYYDIHVGSIGGLAGKIIAFFGSFIAMTLPITGVLIWLGRKKKKKTGRI